MLLWSVVVSCFCRAKWRLWSVSDQMAGVKSMCFVFSNWFDGRSSVNNGFGRYSLQRGERDARDRLELTMSVRVGKEKKASKSRGMLGLKRLISWGDLALHESGRNEPWNGVREVAQLCLRPHQIHNGRVLPWKQSPAIAKQLNN